MDIPLYANAFHAKTRLLLPIDIGGNMICLLICKERTARDICDSYCLHKSMPINAGHLKRDLFGVFLCASVCLCVCLCVCVCVCVCFLTYLYVCNHRARKLYAH